MNNSANINVNTEGKGSLVVMVRTGSGAIPLEGALVTVRGGNTIEGDALASFITDRSGNTPRIALPAPSKRYSESPGDGVPYGIYNVEVSIPGYYTNIYSNIPVFDTITSVQTADMIPLPESGSDLQYGGKEVILFDARTGERLRGQENES